MRLNSQCALAAAVVFDRDDCRLSTAAMPSRHANGPLCPCRIPTPVTYSSRGPRRWLESPDEDDMRGKRSEGNGSSGGEGCGCRRLP
jgi:hypothetical protein